MNASRHGTWGRFDLWAASPFILLAFLAAYAAVFDAKAMPGTVAVAVLLAGLAYPAIDAIVAYGLWQPRGWARPAAVQAHDALEGFGLSSGPVTRAPVAVTLGRTHAGVRRGTQGP